MVSEKVASKIVEADRKVADAVEALNKVLEESMEIYLPIVRDYVIKIRDIRMTIAREVQDMIRSVNQLGEVSKNSEKIKEMAINVGILSEMLQKPEVKKLLLYLAKGD